VVGWARLGWGYDRLVGTGYVEIWACLVCGISQRARCGVLLRLDSCSIDRRAGVLSESA
jgi:hypothetical protein